MQLARVFPLKPARAHEVCGASALAFAAIAAGQARGTVAWLCESWMPAPNPEGLAPFCDPRKLLLTRAPSPADLRAGLEEALRSGALGLVVAEISRPLSLTEGRRLQLAAEAGRTPGLLVIPEGGGSNAAETRWRCEPVFDARDSTRWRWSLIKNKSGTLSDWIVQWDAQARRVSVVSEAAE